MHGCSGPQILQNICKASYVFLETQQPSSRIINILHITEKKIAEHQTQTLLTLDWIDDAYCHYYALQQGLSNVCL